MDGGAWLATFHGVAKSRTRLSDLCSMEKATTESLRCYKHAVEQLSQRQSFSQSRSSNTLATWCEELTHLKRPWCWERLKAGAERDDRGWNGWMSSPIQWTWVWVYAGSCWWTGRPGVLWSMELQRVGTTSGLTQLSHYYLTLLVYRTYHHLRFCF